MIQRAYGSWQGVAKLLWNIAKYIWREIDLNLICMRRKDVYLRKNGVIIGENCDIITHVINFGSEKYLIRIGNHVTVTSGVLFLTHDGSTRLFRRRFPNMNPYGNVFGPILIEDNCFIGVNAILLPNTKIGANSIVGAGAVVKGQFPESSVIAGVPAKRLFSLDEYISRVEKNMIPLQARNRQELKEELLNYFFHEGFSTDA